MTDKRANQWTELARYAQQIEQHPLWTEYSRESIGSVARYRTRGNALKAKQAQIAILAGNLALLDQMGQSANEGKRKSYLRGLYAAVLADKHVVATQIDWLEAISDDEYMVSTSS